MVYTCQYKKKKKKKKKILSFVKSSFLVTVYGWTTQDVIPKTKSQEKGAGGNYHNYEKTIVIYSLPLFDRCKPVLSILHILPGVAWLRSLKRNVGELA